MDATLFSKYQTNIKSRATQRGELLKTFLEKINEGRKGTKYKPLTMAGIAVRLSKLSLNQLYVLASTCKDYENRGGDYARCLWGAIKK
jgi:hypothetical protein